MQENKSIEQLENNYWKDIDFPTPLVEKCYAFRKIPLNQLSIEQVRLLLGQRIGSPFLIPIALRFLEENILAEGAFYPGDLLINVLGLQDDEWKGNESAQNQLLVLINANKDRINAEEDKDLTRRIEAYLQNKMRTT